MKKFLLFVSVAAMSLGAAAQTLPTGEVYLRNVKTGMWLSGGYSWGTKVVLKEQARAFEIVDKGNGFFSLKSSCGFVKNGGGEYYVDGPEDGAAEFGAEEVNGRYMIDFDGNYLCPEKDENGEVKPMMSYKASANSWEYQQTNMQSYDFYPVSHNATYDTADESKQWEILTREQMIAKLADASDTNPIDATFLIKAHRLERNDPENATAWVLTMNGEQAELNFPDWKWGVDNQDNEWVRTNPYCFFINEEAITADCTDVISQEVTGAPAGTYKVDYLVIDQTTSPFTLSFNDTKAEPLTYEFDLWYKSINDAFCNQDNIKTAYFNVGEDGKLAIKMTKESKVGVQNRFAFKSFILTYLGTNSEHAGVEGIAADVADADAPVEYFNMQGMRVAEPTTGLYIVKQGSKVSKQLIRK